MPWNDWQFWIVSLVAVAATWNLVRQMVPRRGPNGRPACGACAAGAAACSKPAATVGSSTRKPSPLVVLSDRR
jgi:hypothetical protein